MRLFASFSADFLLISDILPSLRKISPGGRNAACAIVTAQAALFFRKTFSLPIARQNLLCVLFQHYDEFSEGIFLSDKIKSSVLQCF